MQIRLDIKPNIIKVNIKYAKEVKMLLAKVKH